MKNVLKILAGAAVVGTIGFFSYKFFFAKSVPKKDDGGEQKPLDNFIDHSKDTTVKPPETKKPEQSVHTIPAPEKPVGLKKGQQLYAKNYADIILDPKNGLVSSNVVGSVNPGASVGLFEADYVLKKAGYAPDPDWIAVKTFIGTQGTDRQVRYIRRSYVKTDKFAADGSEMLNGNGSDEMINSNGGGWQMAEGWQGGCELIGKCASSSGDHCVDCPKSMKAKKNGASHSADGWDLAAGNEGGCEIVGKCAAPSGDHCIDCPKKLKGKPGRIMNADGSDFFNAVRSNLGLANASQTAWV